jgi:hypothetical protein
MNKAVASIMLQLADYKLSSEALGPLSRKLKCNRTRLSSIAHPGRKEIARKQGG